MSENMNNSNNDTAISLIALDDLKSPITEAYRTIRTNLQFANVGEGEGNSLRTIIMTSAVQNSGKSTTISNIALVMAQAGSRVLLVDCDLRNPTMHKLFKMRNTGLTNIVATGMEPADCIKKCEQPNLYLLPAGPVPPNPSELLASKRVRELLAQAREVYDYVLLDMPPILPVTDAAIMSSRVDGVIMCVPCNQTHPKMEQEAKKRLEQAGAHIVGVVMNKVDIATNKYYGKYYGHNYGYYYYYSSEDGKKKHRHHSHNQETEGKSSSRKLFGLF